MSRQIITKQELVSIVNKNVYDLGYRKKFSKGYYDDLVDGVFNDLDFDSKSSSELIQRTKCPKVITSLPHDLRTTDVGKLQERLDEANDTLSVLEDELQEEKIAQDDLKGAKERAIKERDEAQKNLDDYHKREDDFRKADEQLLGEALDESSEIRKDWKSLMDTANFGDGEGLVVEMPKVNGIYNLDTLMNIFGSEFEYTGFLNGEDSDVIRAIADSVEEFGNSNSDGTNITDWTNEASSLADTIRAFADKHDINKNPLGDELQDLTNIAGKGLPSDWQDIIDDTDEMLNRYDESIQDSIKIQTSIERDIGYLKQDIDKTSAKINKYS